MSQTSKASTQPAANPSAGQTSAAASLRTLKPRRMAYLVSTYPTLSMIFVLREVLELRKLGFEIATASINRPDRPQNRMTAEEASEAQATYCIKRHGLPGALAAHLLALVRNGKGYGRALLLLPRLAGLDLKQWLYHAAYLTEALMLGRWMRRQKLKHLHVHLAQQAATVGLYAKTVFPIGFSITVHGPDEFYDADRQALGRKAAAADFLVCISSFARSQMMKHTPYLHWHKMVVAPLGVDTELFMPRPHQPAPDTFEVLCVGRLVAAKGQHMLMDAIDRLAAEGHNVRLRLVGSGPDEASLKVHTARLDRPTLVAFEGAVNQDRIRLLYGQAHVFAIASFAEGLPVVLMEAMAMEIPCVTTQINGIPEMIRDNIDGLLVAPSDLESLTDALRSLLDDEKLRARLGRAGRKRIAERYHLGRNVERLARIFSALVRE